MNKNYLSVSEHMTAITRLPCKHEFKYQHIVAYPREKSRIKEKSSPQLPFLPVVNLRSRSLKIFEPSPDNTRIPLYLLLTLFYQNKVLQEKDN